MPPSEGAATPIPHSWPRSRPANSFRSRPYPGQTPNYPYVIDAGMVRPLPQSVGSAVPSPAGLRGWLPEHTAQHIPLLTYGSNACPGRLAQKFADPSGIAVFPANVSDVVRVWSCRVNYMDAVPATLAAAPGASTTAHVLLLPAQLAHEMDVSEERFGPCYRLVRLLHASVQLPGGPVWQSPLTYLGHAERGPLIISGRVLPLSEFTEAAARSAIEKRHGVGDDSFLPEHHAYSSDTPLTAALRSGEVTQILGTDPTGRTGHAT